MQGCFAEKSWQWLTQRIRKNMCWKKSRQYATVIDPSSGKMIKSAIAPMIRKTGSPIRHGLASSVAQRGYQRLPLAKTCRNNRMTLNDEVII